MTPSDFDHLRRLLKQRSGLHLSVDKQPLVESRLASLARREGLDDLDKLCQALGTGDARLITEVVEAMTTNETSFFRDRTPFDQLRDSILPTLLRARADRRRLRILSAGCSSGQEPYSIAMCCKELGARLAGWDVEIVAIDISAAMLARSEAGVFSQVEVQRGLPIHLLLKYFTQIDDVWQVTPDLRAIVTHRPFNVLDDMTTLGVFDLIFCRNVLAYFDRDTQAVVCGHLAQALHTDGYLVLGATESVLGITDAFKPHPDNRGIHRRELRSPSLAPRMSPFKVVA